MKLITIKNAEINNMISKQMQAGRYSRKSTVKIPSAHKGKEQELESMCEDYLELKGFCFIRIPDSIYSYFFGINSKTPQWLKVFVSRFLKGVPDLTILYKNGTYKCIELKNEKGKQSQGQKDFEKKCGKGNYYICRSFEQFVRIVGNDE